MRRRSGICDGGLGICDAGLGFTTPVWGFTTPVYVFATVVWGLQQPADSKPFRLALIRLQSQRYLMEDVALAADPEIRALLAKLYELAPEMPWVKEALGRSLDDPGIRPVRQIIAQSRENFADGLRFTFGEGIVVIERSEGGAYFDADPSELSGEWCPKILGFLLLVQAVGWARLCGFFDAVGLPVDVVVEADESVSCISMTWGRGG